MQAGRSVHPFRDPLILAIKGNALDDGPGIRSVVFFKGCPLSCAWCHNPESKRLEVEISFDARECVHCDTCLSVCPVGALHRDNPYFIDRSTCNLCFLCTEACPARALNKVGKSMTVEEILPTLIRDKPFYEISGGGVSLSGGEPTLFMEFAGRLLQALNSNGVRTLLQTCGLFNLYAFNEWMYPWLDYIYYDLKIVDREIHARYCGAENEVILANFRELARRSHNGGVPLLPRTPLIPGITDTTDNLKAIAAFLVECDVHRAKLLPYHPLWQEKSRMLGLPSPFAERPEMEKWLERENLARSRAIFREAGVEV